MASEEERAKIMAEYLAGINDKNAADDEEDFVEEDDSGDDEAPVDYPILKGRLKFNDAQHLVYLGTWCMKNDNHPAAKAANGAKKFKLKSTTPLSFPLHKPTTAAPIVMNGFFQTTADGDSSAKIKEYGVELTFTKHTLKKGTTYYDVKGKGKNDYGAFTMDGTYAPNEEKEQFWLKCNKKYSGGAKKTYDDSDDDISEQDDHGADAAELGDLETDANLSVEELRAKYYNSNNNTASSGTVGDNDDTTDAKPPPEKKQKVKKKVASDDEDDDCGF